MYGHISKVITEYAQVIEQLAALNRQSKIILEEVATAMAMGGDIAEALSVAKLAQ